MANYRNGISCLVQSVILIGLFNTSFAQPPAWDWVQAVYESSRLYSYDVAVENFTGEAVIVGSWQPDLSTFWGDNNRPSTDFSVTYGAADGFVARYDTLENVIWAFKIGGPSMDEVRSVTIDPNGDIFITGKIDPGLSNFAGTASLTADSTILNADNTDCFIAKYNRAGELLWLSSSIGSDTDVSGKAISANHSAVFIAGEFSGNLTLGAQTFPVTARNVDLFLAKLDLDGNIQWIVGGGSLTLDNINDLEADDDEVYFIGNYTGMQLDFYDVSGGITESISNVAWGWEDIFITGYDADGNFLWTRGIGSNYIDFGNGIAMDSIYVYATGGIYNNAYFPGYSGNPVPVSNNMDIFISSHERNNGQTSWLKVIPSGGTNDDYGHDIDMDISNQIHVTGIYLNTLDFFGDTSLAAMGGQDLFLASFNTDGIFNWAKTGGSSANQDVGYSVASGFGGRIYVTGTYDKEDTFDTIILPGANNSNIFLGSMRSGFVDFTTPPENDNPCSAILLPVGDTCNATTYDNNYATNSGIPDPGCADYAGGDVWFTAVIPPSGNLFIGTNTSTDDTYPPTNEWMYRVGMAVYSGTCGALDLEGCFSYNSAYHYRASSAFLFDENPGDTIWIRIWEQLGDDPGRFYICTYDPGHYPAWKIPENLCVQNGLIDLDTTITGTITGFVDQVVEFSGIPDPTNVLGAPDLANASLFEDGDWIKLDLTDTIPAGETYQIIFQSNSANSGVTQMTLWESVDNLTYYPLSFKPETEWDIVTSHFIIAEHPTRYLLIENDSAGGGGFALDGIEYHFRGTRGGTWSGPGVTGSLFDPSGLSGLVPITYSVGGSTTFTDSTNIINILKSHGGILSPDTSVCYGNQDINLELNNYTGEVLKWEFSMDDFLTTLSFPITDPFLTISNLTETTQFRVIVKDGLCEPDTSNSITIALYPQSAAHLSGDTTICYGSAATLSINLTGVSPWDLEYENDIDTIPITGILTNPYVFNVSSSLITTYSIVSLVDGNGCSGPISGSATVEPIPIVNAGKDTTICGLTFRLEAMPSTGTGIWSQSAGPGTSMFSPGTAFSDAEVTVDTYGAYEFTWEETDGACVDDSTITIEFYESPMADAGPGSIVCGLTAGLQANPIVGMGTWSVLNGPGTAVFTPDENDPSASVSVNAAGIYEILWTETNGPCSDSDTITITFFDQPVANAGTGGEECDLDFQLQAIPGTGTGEWTKISGPGSATFSPSANDSDAEVIVDEYGSYGFIWTETNGTCSDNITVYVNFFDRIIVDAGADGDVCGQEYVLNATPGNGSGYWTKISGTGKVSFSPSDTASSVTVSVDEFGSYEFQWFEAIGDCSGSDNVEIRFHEQPTADAGPDQVLENVFSTYLDAGITEFGTGNWELVEGTGLIQDRNDPGSQVTGLSLGENEFSWTIKTGVCEDVTDKVMIKVNDLLTPTVITPNNDGYNDYLVFSGTDELNDNEIIIYSRWGTEVYRNKDYQNDWDGRDHNNRELPLDTYYYILKLSSGRLIKGFIEIRR